MILRREEFLSFRQLRSSDDKVVVDTNLSRGNGMPRIFLCGGVVVGGGVILKMGVIWWCPQKQNNINI